MKKIKFILFVQLGLVIAATIILSGCYPGGAEYVSDTDIVITNYNSDFDFKSVKHYYMPDSIRHITGDTTTEPDRSQDEFILSELERNFEARGYVRIDTNDLNNGEEPEVIVVASALRVDNYVIYGYYPGWCWGWYCYPGYGWYYPTYVSSYETGTVFWDMFDPANVDDDNKIIKVEWTGAVNGVLGSKSNNESRLTKGIDQAFLQSPYLVSE